MNEQEVLHRPFDIETHKKTFINYLEVTILPDGTVEYAVPSHQEHLIGFVQRMTGMSRQEVFNKCPKEYFFDVTQWLCNYTGCIAVWNDYIIKPDRVVTDMQIQTLQLLKKEGLFKGEI